MIMSKLNARIIEGIRVSIIVVGNTNHKQYGLGWKKFAKQKRYRIILDSGSL